MNTSPSPDPIDTALVQWANRQLGLDDHAAPESVRAAARDRLAEDDFLPSLRRQHAVQLLCRADRPKVLPPVALEDEEQRLRAELDDFAAEFFQQDCLARRRRWRDLQRQCQPFPPLAARLAALEAGLNAPGVDELPADPDLRELAEHLQALFVTRPAVRPGLRRMLLGKLESEIDRWSAAAVHLREREPPLAALDYRFLDQLAHWKQNKKLQQKGRRQRIATSVETSSSGSGGGSSGGGHSGWLVVLLVVTLLRILAMVGSRSSDTLPSNAPTLQTSRDSSWPDAERRRLAEIAVGSRRIQKDEFREWLHRRQWEREHPEQAAARAASMIGLLASPEGSLAATGALAAERQRLIVELKPLQGRADE